MSVYGDRRRGIPPRRTSLLDEGLHLHRYEYVGGDNPVGSNPDIQVRIQKETAAVVLRERLPTYADRESLPYLEAAILEVMRCKTLGPLGGMPHTTDCGYFIPANSTVTCILPSYSRARYFLPSDSVVGYFYHPTL